MELFLIYLWLKLDAIVGLALAVGIVISLISGFMWIPRGVDDYDHHQDAQQLPNLLAFGAFNNINCHATTHQDGNVFGVRKNHKEAKTTTSYKH